jgi:SAM-dependent methyltransferase
VFIVPLLKRAIEAQLEAHAKPLGSGGKVLDVGCGRQPLRKQLENYGFEYFGLDTQAPEDGSVAFVTPIDGPLPPDLSAEAPFAFLLCTEVLEHVADWAGAFANLARLTAPGGKVLLTCPHFYPLHEEPFDFWRPTPHALRHFAAAAGFKVITLEKLGDTWDVLGTLLGATNPIAGTWSWRARVLSVVVNRGVRAVFYLLRKGWLLRRVPLGSKLYLSNVAVLERA